MDLSDLRISYTKDSFSESDLLESPFDQFEKWFSEALKSKVDEPNAMSLATISPDGNPRTRIIGKGFFKGWFDFLYQLRKC